MSYTNADGLRVLTFKDQGAVQDQGHTQMGPTDHIILDVDLTEVGTTYVSDANDPFIGAGATITRAVLLTKEAAAGGVSFDVGLYNAETDAAIDANGIFAAVATADMAQAGDTVQGAGALVGGTFGTSANDTRIGVVRTGAAFTAGRVKIMVEYFD